MARLSDQVLWDSVQDAAAKSGFTDRTALIEAATEGLCKRHRLRSDAEREDISGRLSALWVKNMTVTEPN